MVRCAVFNCYNAEFTTHRFPQPNKFPERFQQWVNLCGDAELLTKPGAVVYNNYRICNRHFEPAYQKQNQRLSSDAIPSLFMPASRTEDDPVELAETVHSNVAPMKIKSTSAQVMATPIHAQQMGTKLQSIIGYELGSSGKLLTDVHVTREVELTPKAKHMYRQATYSRKRLAAAKRSHRKFRQRMLHVSKSMTDYTGTSSLDRIRSRFFASQVENVDKKPQGRRYTQEDKILGLALYKQGGSSYKLLSKLFTLPSRKTLMALMNGICIQPGFNDAVLEVLRGEAVTMKNDIDRFCILMFDEMSICAHLDWNTKLDRIEGFEDFGYRRSNNIANHVQVFMIRSINSKWKQPLYFNFVNGAAKYTEIMRTIKEITRKLSEIGYVVVATVCDQGANNAAAIKQLIADTKGTILRAGLEMRETFFKVDDISIVPLFDPPHLLKGLRNNLLTKNLQCTINEEQLTAKWQHIHWAYEIDGNMGSLRVMPKITDFHVVPSKIKKMKVSCCTQVFSHSMAAAINLMAKSGCKAETANGIISMPKEAEQTAKILSFLDDLFDSINGFAPFDKCGKPLRVSVREGTPHLKFWRDAISVLKTMQFVDGRTISVPPSVKNWIVTLEGFISLYKRLTAVGFRSMVPRTFNQDPVENFFGKIRQRGARYNNPTATAFIPFYKSLLITNLTKSHSPGANCAEDEGDLLTSLQSFVLQKPTPLAANVIVQLPELPNTFEPKRRLTGAVMGYVSGFVTLKVLRKTKDCLACKKNLLLVEDQGLTSEHDLVIERNYSKTKRMLQYCNPNFIAVLTRIYNIFNFYFGRICHERYFSTSIIQAIENKVEFNFINCNHSEFLKKFIISYFIRILIFHNCKALNNILTGKDDRNLKNAGAIYKKVWTFRSKNKRKQTRH